MRVNKPVTVNFKGGETSVAFSISRRVVFTSSNTALSESPIRWGTIDPRKLFDGRDLSDFISEIPGREVRSGLMGVVDDARPSRMGGEGDLLGDLRMAGMCGNSEHKFNKAEGSR